MNVTRSQASDSSADHVFSLEDDDDDEHIVSAMNGPFWITVERRRLGGGNERSEVVSIGAVPTPLVCGDNSGLRVAGWFEDESAEEASGASLDRSNAMSTKSGLREASESCWIKFNTLFLG